MAGTAAAVAAGAGAGGLQWLILVVGWVVVQVPRLEALLEGRLHELEAAREEARESAASAEASRRAAAVADSLARDASEALQVAEVRMEALRAEAGHAGETHSAAVEDLRRRLEAAEVICG